MVTRGFHAFAIFRFDHDRSIHAALLLQVGVTVIPIGSSLPERKFKDPRLARLDRRRGDVRHAILRIRHQQAMPVDRCLFTLEQIFYANACRIAFPKSQRRPWNATIEHQGPRRLHSRFRRPTRFGDIQVILNNAGKKHAARRKNGKNVSNQSNKDCLPRIIKHLPY